eukprot:TRINITY_DN9194_c0_g1_i1.p1 TRINITY_DN9194_c0_g1~~TRINITY_DN9194_c0_g1_i1.p1  ORF type:complete len:516 (+),score=97.90 TRINITY_DN9194_c0_g1_i1:43-1548(+)
MALVCSLETTGASGQSGGAFEVSSPCSAAAPCTVDERLNHLQNHLKKESDFVNVLLAAQEDLLDELRCQAEDLRFFEAESNHFKNRLREEEKRAAKAEAMLITERKAWVRRASSQDAIIENLHKERCAHVSLCQQKDEELTTLQRQFRKVQEELSGVRADLVARTAELAKFLENEAPFKREDGAPPRPVASSLPDETPCMPSKDAGGTARYGFAVEQGQRRSMEDGVICVPKLEYPGAEEACIELYGVVDGHGGQGAVDFVTRCLASKMTELCSSAKDENSVGDVLQTAIASLDAELLDIAKTQDANTASGFSSGACACIMTVERSSFTIANCGDCRAVLCRKGSPVKIETITTDHHASDITERERLSSQGVDVTSDGYVHGHLAVTRAFGDFSYQSQMKCSGVICTPDLFQVAISDDVEFAVLACDGVFEVMSAQEAVLEVRRALRQKGSPQAAAQALTQYALQKNSTDNVSAVVVVFNAPEAAPERRAPKLALIPRKAA